MGSIKSLVKDTAVYGLSSIIGRFLNWCLTPLYTLTFATQEYGVVTYVYSAVALALVILTYGMETGFFRFANHDRWKDPMQVYSTALISLATSGALFIGLMFIFVKPIAWWLECGEHDEYVWMMAICVAIDAFTALPFSYLRYKKNAMRFAALKLINIGINICLNLFFILVCPFMAIDFPVLMSWFKPEFGIGYIFLANLIASTATLIMLAPELRGFRWTFCGKLWREMIRYSSPLLVNGVAGIMNQTLDKILFPLLYVGVGAMAQLGIYGANYKIAIVMVMFIQAFRFAYEPFIFAQNKAEGKAATASYSDAMKYFVIAGMFIFMGVMFYLDILRYFISPNYFAGLTVVPIVMIAEFFFGIHFNLSVWYKLTDRTHWGAWFSILGLAVTIGLNVLLVPSMGYMGCAWAAFACYGSMMLASYFIGQAKYPINYHVKRLAAYVGIAIVLYVLGVYVLVTPWMWLNFIIRAILLTAYAAIIMRAEHASIKSILQPLLHR